MQNCETSSLRTTLSSFSISELLIPETMPEEITHWLSITDNSEGDDKASPSSGTPVITRQADRLFSAKRGNEALCRWFDVASISAFGTFSDEALSAIGVLLDYLELTQAGKLPSLKRPRQELNAQRMLIDAPTRQSLELHQTQSGQRKGSLIASIDRTITGPGARALNARIAAPLTNASRINDRLNEIAYCIDHADLTDEWRALLKSVPDMTRALQRLSVERGGPRDLQAVLKGLQTARQIAHAANQHSGAESGNMKDLHPIPACLSTRISDLDGGSNGDPSSLIDLLKRCLREDVPLLARDGGFVQKGFDPSLDEVLILRDDARRVIASLENQYQRENRPEAFEGTSE